MNIGLAIREIRKQLGLNQAEFSSRIEITQTSLSQIESGNSFPSPKTVKKIKEVFDIPEPLIYILSIDENDVPANRRDLYDRLFPVVKKLALEILDYSDNK